MQIKDSSQAERIVFLDYLRVIACFMVIMVHSCEFFFIDGDSIGIRSVSDGFWVSVIDSAFRSSVPLFVMASSYLLLPLTTSSSFLGILNKNIEAGIPTIKDNAPNNM